jgi:hypothetical protein
MSMNCTSAGMVRRLVYNVAHVLAVLFQSQMFFHFSHRVPNLLFESWDVSTPARELLYATVMAG